MVRVGTEYRVITLLSCVKEWKLVFHLVISKWSPEPWVLNESECVHHVTGFHIVFYG